MELQDKNPTNFGSNLDRIFKLLRKFHSRPGNGDVTGLVATSIPTSCGLVALMVSIDVVNQLEVYDIENR